jgi:4-amino-4-deoxychorismate lyase
MNEVPTLVNGDPITSVSVTDRGFQYGDGVFETIAIYRGAPLLWDRHMARLMRGAERLGIAAPSPSLLVTEAKRLCADAQRAVLKVVVTRGAGARGYATHGTTTPTRVLTLSPWPDYPEHYARIGVSVRICETTLASNPRLAGIKHLNRLEQVLARAEWGSEHAEGLMCDQQGNVVAATMSNIFVVAGGILRTPDVTACGVEGIMRSVVLDATRQLKLQCDIGPIARADVAAAAEIFLSNSLIGVWPVRQIDDTEYTIGPITRHIQEAIREAHCFDRH